MDRTYYYAVFLGGLAGILSRGLHALTSKKVNRFSSILTLIGALAMSGFLLVGMGLIRDTGLPPTALGLLLMAITTLFGTMIVFPAIGAALFNMDGRGSPDILIAPSPRAVFHRPNRSVQTRKTDRKNLWRIFREDFSLYEQAVIIRYAKIVLIGVAMFGFWNGSPMIAIVVVPYLALHMVDYTIVLCPNCEKPPSRIDWNDNNESWFRNSQMNFWPDRICDSCGFQLDVIHDD